MIGIFIFCLFIFYVFEYNSFSGDLWSYNSDKDQFIVSPNPDVHVIDIDVESHRCLIFGTDGLWNMMTPQDGVLIVQEAEQHNETHVYFSGEPATARVCLFIFYKFFLIFSLIL